MQDILICFSFTLIHTLLDIAVVQIILVTPVTHRTV